MWAESVSLSPRLVMGVAMVVGVVGGGVEGDQASSEPRPAK